MAGAVPKEPGISPSVEPGIGTPPFQADVVPDVQEMDTVHHLGGPVMGAVPSGPGVVGVGPCVPPPVVVRPCVGRARRGPEPGARVGCPRALPLPVVASFPLPLSRHTRTRVERPGLVATTPAKSQPTEVAPETPAVAAATAQEVERRPGRGPARLVQQARASTAARGREARMATVRRVKSALAGPDAAMGARVGSLAQVLLQFRRSGESKRP